MVSAKICGNVSYLGDMYQTILRNGVYFTTETKP